VRSEVAPHGGAVLRDGPVRAGEPQRRLPRVPVGVHHSRHDDLACYVHYAGVDLMRCQRGTDVDDLVVRDQEVTDQLARKLRGHREEMAAPQQDPAGHRAVTVDMCLAPRIIDMAAVVRVSTTLGNRGEITAVEADTGGSVVAAVVRTSRSHSCAGSYRFIRCHHIVSMSGPGAFRRS
jgi:hypothetical protein